MPEPVYQSDPAAEPDSHFLAGELALAVAGNRGRLGDARRTPLTLTAVDLPRGEIEVRIDAFEDEGARWRLPLWEVSRLQLARDSDRAAPGTTRAMHDACERFRRALVVDADLGAAADTWRRVAEQRTAVGPALAGLDPPIDLRACVERREGDAHVCAALDRYLASQDLLAMDQSFCATMVSNPASGELVKGHALVLAELGLCRFDGTVVRDPGLFDEPWSRRRRARHLIARMAFIQELWAVGVEAPLILYRAAATERPLCATRSASFVSCTFSEPVADAHFAGGPATPHAVKWRQAVDPARLVMTFLETAAFSQRFKEAEAVLIGDPGNPAF